MTMRFLVLARWTVAVLVLWLLTTTIAYATEAPARYTNDNLQTSHHEAPASFSRDANGNFSGFTVGGRLFTQVVVANDYNVRLQRFTIDDAHFYISNRGVIYADTDLAALSIYFARTA